MQRRRNDAEYEGDVSGVDFPQGYQDSCSGVKVKDDDDKPRGVRAGSSRRNEDGNGWMLKFSLLMTIVLVASYFLVAHHEERQLEHLRQNIIHDELEPLSREWEEKYATLEEENQQLKRNAKANENLRAEADRFREELSKQQRVREKLSKQLDHLEAYKMTMIDNVKLMSKTALVEKFGPGPHHVEIALAFHPDFPKNHESDGETAAIKILLADKDEMPHAVYWFLEQVSRKLYDGCSFHRNAGHVVQGGPAPNFLSPPNPQLAKRFKDASFYSILFQEYSAKYPHKKYTLGYAGRPGGPDFYISVQDNTKIHGPGGQTSYEDASEADPCFAKVVEGFDVVDRMQLGAVKPGAYHAFETNVAIRSMRILDGTGTVVNQ